MSWDKGFDFRATSGYVTDGTNCTWVVSEAYPKTRNGCTFGWDNVGNESIRDRVTGGDPRLAGVQWSTGSIAKFQVDLPSAADYTIDLALGDPSGGANSVYSKVYDNSTLLATIGPHTNSSGQFYDASDVNRTSEAAWVSNHATIQKTFASTTFFVSVEQNLAPISHLFLHQVAAGGLPIPVAMHHFNSSHV